MRRKNDMWNNLHDRGFLPAEGEQAARTAAADVQERLTTLEDQLHAQFNAMSAYHQIALKTSATARAEARADLDREKATLVSLVERVRDECSGAAIRVDVAGTPEPASEPLINVNALARIALVEDQLADLGRQVARCLRSQEELAASISLMFDQQMRNAGLVVNAGEVVS